MLQYLFSLIVISYAHVLRILLYLFINVICYTCIRPLLIVTISRYHVFVMYMMKWYVVFIHF